jgi:hypothetical protein
MHAGYLPKTHADLFKPLEYHDSPLYTGTLIPLCGDTYAWEVQVTLYEKATKGGVHRVHQVNEDTTPRATFNAGIKDVAYQALAALWREEIDVICQLQYHLFSRRAPDSAAVHVPSTQRNDQGGYLKEQVRLTHALNVGRTEALKEIEFHYDQEEEIEDLQSILEH